MFSFRRVQTDILDIAYEECGPPDGPAVMLLHGWPDDIRTWDKVVAKLAEAGLRTIAPYLRGFGPTKFIDNSTLRSGQLSALATDATDLAQVLKLDRWAIIGHDWGARAAYIASLESSEKVSHVVALSVGYGTNNPQQQLSLRQTKNYWYHWYFCLPTGNQTVQQSRRDLCEFLWKTWSPTWNPDPSEFNITAESFDNPDWAEITIHSYRHRWAQAEGDPRYEELEQRLAVASPCEIPTLVLHGECDACNDPSTSDRKEDYFTGGYRRVLLPNVGHFPQREAPDLVAHEILNWLSK